MSVHRLPEDVERALGDLNQYVRRRFGARLLRSVLFGSFARGEGDLVESDVDVLLVIEGLTLEELREVVGEAAVISSTHNVLLSPLALSAERYLELEEQDRLLVREIARDGVAP